MTRIHLLPAFLFCAGLAVLSACQSKTAHSNPQLPDVNTDFDRGKHLLDSAARATEWKVFEGLPHQNFEREQLEHELQREATVTIKLFPFYQTPREINAEQRDIIRKLFERPGNFRPFRGEKKCGGFHPDYLLECRDQEQVLQILVCLGCSEIMIFGSDQSLRCDLGVETKDELKDRLSVFDARRPKRSGEKSSGDR